MKCLVNLTKSCFLSLSRPLISTIKSLQTVQWQRTIKSYIISILLMGYPQYPKNNYQLMKIRDSFKLLGNPRTLIIRQKLWLGRISTHEALCAESAWRYLQIYMRLYFYPLSHSVNCHSYSQKKNFIANSWLKFHHAKILLIELFRFPFTIQKYSKT